MIKLNGLNALALSLTYTGVFSMVTLFERFGEGGLEGGGYCLTRKVMQKRLPTPGLDPEYKTTTFFHMLFQEKNLVLYSGQYGNSLEMLSDCVTHAQRVRNGSNAAGHIQH